MTFTIIQNDKLFMHNMQQMSVNNSSQYSLHQDAYPENPAYANEYEFVVSSLFQNKHTQLVQYSFEKIYENDTLNLVEYIRQSSSPIARAQQADKPYPIAVRYISKDGKLYIERYPFKVHFEFYDATRKKYISKQDDLTIWVPWTISELTPDTTVMRIFYSSKSLSSMDDQYFLGALPNSYGNGSICWGTSMSAYPEMQYDFSTGRISAPPQEVFSKLFNEYFSGGWNTDLGSNIYTYINYLVYSNKISPTKHPMITRFLHPDANYITKRFRHISAARRRMLMSGFQACEFNRLKQCAYVLYMLSDFTLPETLAFYEELNSIQDGTESQVLSFQKIIDQDDSSTLFDDGLFNYSNLGRPPLQNDQLLTSTQQFSNAEKIMHVYYYNIHVKDEFNEKELYYRSWVLPSVVGPIWNKVLTDFLTDSNYNSSNTYVYMINVFENTYEKIVVPQQSFSLYPYSSSREKQVATAFDAAHTHHVNISSIAQENSHA